MAVVINGSGTVTGISVGGLPDDIVDAGTLADDAVGLAQMASGTDGNVITYDTSGNPAAVSTGSSGQVLTSAGSGAAPTMATLSAGKVLQVVQKNDISRTTISSTSGSTYTAHYGQAITPSASSSHILILVCQPGRIADSGTLMRGSFRLSRGSTVKWNTSNFGEHIHARNAPDEIDMTQYIQFLDSPSTTSATTYNVTARLDTGTTFDLWESAYGANMILMEIAG